MVALDSSFSSLLLLLLLLADVLLVVGDEDRLDREA